MEALYQTGYPQESPGRLLCSAAASGDLDALRGLVGRGMDVDSPDACGMTPLMCAAMAGQTDAAWLLISQGAGVDAVSADGNTPLQYACMSGSAKVVALLLSNGVDVDTACFDGSTPLHHAVRAGHAGIARMLLEQGADTAAMDADGLTAMDAANAQGDRGMARLLASYGAEGYVPDPVQPGKEDRRFAWGLRLKTIFLANIPLYCLVAVNSESFVPWLYKLMSGYGIVLMPLLCFISLHVCLVLKRREWPASFSCKSFLISAAALLIAMALVIMGGGHSYSYLIPLGIGGVVTIFMCVPGAGTFTMGGNRYFWLPWMVVYLVGSSFLVCLEIWIVCVVAAACATFSSRKGRRGTP